MMADKSLTAELNLRASDDARRMAGAYNTIDELLSCMAEAIHDWSERDGRIFSIASAGEVYTREDDGSETIPCNLFQEIHEKAMDTGFAGILRASLARIKELQQSGK